MAQIVKWPSLFKSRFFKYGVPFFVLMVGGSFGLKEFTSLRYQYSKKTVLTPEEANVLEKAKNVTLESEYEKIKKIDIDNWENKRGPRPWEEDFQKNVQKKS